MLLKKKNGGPRWRATLPDFGAALGWSPDGGRLAVATLAGSVLVLDGAGGETISSWPGHPGGALALAWSPDGEVLATGGQDGSIEIHRKGGKSTTHDAGGGAWVEHLAWSPDGKWLASAAGRVVRLWPREGTQGTEVRGYPSTVSSLFWMPSTGDLVTSCYGGLQFIVVGRDEWAHEFKWKGSILTAAPSPDGRFIATGNQDASVHVWETKTGEDLQMTGYPLKVRELAWCATGPLLATGGAAVVTVWSFAGKGPAGSTPDELKGHEARVTGISFAGESRRLVSAGEDKTLRVWEWRRGWRCVRVETAEVPLRSLALCTKGAAAACAGDDGHLVVWSLEDSHA